MYRQLNSEQRYEIYLGLQRGWSKSRIAREIGVSASTVCREVRRNGKPDGSYMYGCGRRSSVTAVNTAWRATTARAQNRGGVWNG